MPYNIAKTFYVTGLIAGSVIRVVYSGNLKKTKVAADHETLLDKLLLALSSLGFIIFPLLYLLTDWLAFADYNLQG